MEPVQQHLESRPDRGDETVGVPCRSGAGQLPDPFPQALASTQQFRKDSKFVRPRPASAGQHDGRVQRGDIAMHHRPGHPPDLQRRILPRDGLRGHGRGDGMAPGEIFPEHEPIDLRPVVRKRRLLIAGRKDPRLDVVTGREHRRYLPGFADVVEGITEKRVRIVIEVPACLGARDIGPVRGRHAEMAGHILEAVFPELAVALTVALREKPGVDDVAPVNLVVRIRDDAVAGLKARRPVARHSAVPAHRQVYAVPPGALVDVRKVEAKDVVPLDHVRIPGTDFQDHLRQHLPFVMVPAGYEPLPTAAVRHGDGGDAIAFPKRIGKFETVRPIHLQVDLHAHQAVEAHAEEMRLPGPEKVLLHRVAQVQVRRAGGAEALAAVALEIGLGRLQASDIRKPGQPAELACSRQRLDLAESPPSRDLVLGRQPKERLEWNRVGRQRRSRPGEEPDMAISFQLHTHDPRRRVVTVQHRIVWVLGSRIAHE